ncbi:hypothetical protein [Tomitella biformata]|uniref:hypothetical protein n=1 Tax=Tomitella biformata TaxID=630403 RepID=UPI0004660E1E|nr:hypothetical protein [Tomitella biformata]
MASADSAHTVRTLTLAEYQASHPTIPMFPATSETVAKVVMILLYALIVIGIVYIALRSSGVVN